jgi:hypothetical protein
MRSERLEMMSSLDDKLVLRLQSFNKVDIGEEIPHLSSSLSLVFEICNMNP